MRSLRAKHRLYFYRSHLDADETIIQRKGLWMGIHVY